jgi:hypothetical protein
MGGQASTHSATGSFKRLIPVAVAFFEQRELGAGVGSFAAHDDPHLLRPAGQLEQPGGLRVVTTVSEAADSIDRRCPHLGWQA